MNHEPNYVEIREPGTEKLLARIDVERQILEFKRRKIVTYVDLAQLRQQVESSPDRSPDSQR